MASLEDKHNLLQDLNYHRTRVHSEGGERDWRGMKMKKTDMKEALKKEL